MNTWIDCIMVILILTNLVLLGSSRLNHCIRLIAGQGMLLGLLPLMVGSGEVTLRMLLLSTGTLSLKGFVFPWLLLRSLREADIRREVEPFVGYISSVLTGLLALAVSIWLSSRLPVVASVKSSLVMPVALFMILVGLFIISSRRKALNQILGYIVLENGMFSFGLVMLEEIPLMVELGILLDAFVAVFVMGVAIYHIQREFDHMDTDQLDSLKG